MATSATTSVTVATFSKGTVATSPGVLFATFSDITLVTVSDVTAATVPGTFSYLHFLMLLLPQLLMLISLWFYNL